jgi:hypothetical protein
VGGGWEIQNIKNILLPCLPKSKFFFFNSFNPCTMEMVDLRNAHTINLLIILWKDGRFFGIRLDK